MPTWERSGDCRGSSIGLKAKEKLELSVSTIDFARCMFYSSTVESHYRPTGLKPEQTKEDRWARSLWDAFRLIWSMYVTRPFKSRVTPHIWLFLPIEPLLRETWVDEVAEYVLSSRFPDIDRNPPISEPHFQISQVSLQISDQKCRLLERC